MLTTSTTTSAELASMLRRPAARLADDDNTTRDVKKLHLDHDHIRVPLHAQQGLTAAGLLVALAATVPWTFLDYSAPLAELAIATFQGLLVGAMAIDLSNSLKTISRRRKVIYHRVPRSHLFGYIGFAIVGALAALGAIAILAAGLGGCATRTDETLLEYVFNLTCNQSDPNLVNISSLELRRTPFVFTNLSWYQACLDDLFVLIFLLAANGALAALDIAIAIVYGILLRNNEVPSEADGEAAADDENDGRS